MESYEIEFQPSVRKDFRKLSPDNASRILPQTRSLSRFMIATICEFSCWYNRFSGGIDRQLKF
jgi:hypothetical protein